MSVKILVRGTFAALCALALAGCATITETRAFNGVHVDSDEKPTASVEVTNNGWFLFKFIPLASGDPKHPNENSCRVFRNTVTLQNNLEMLDLEMARLGTSRFLNLTSYYTDETFLFVLLARRSFHTSAVVLK